MPLRLILSRRLILALRLILARLLRLILARLLRLILARLLRLILTWLRLILAWLRLILARIGLILLWLALILTLRRRVWPSGRGRGRAGVVALGLELGLHAGVRLRRAVIQEHVPVLADRGHRRAAAAHGGLRDGAASAARTDLRAAAHAQRDVAVHRFEMREAGLEPAVIVEDRSVGARGFDLMRRATAEGHVSGGGSHPQPLE